MLHIYFPTLHAICVLNETYPRCMHSFPPPQRGLNETYTGGIGSYMLVLMVVHVVQVRRGLLPRQGLDQRAR